MMLSLLQGTLQLGGSAGGSASFSGVLVIGKIIVLILAIIHIILAIRVWIQVWRLERWLPMLKGRGFSIWALLHLVLAFLGMVLAAVVL